jgi:hypothetical protein
MAGYGNNFSMDWFGGGYDYSGGNNYSSYGGGSGIDWFGSLDGYRGLDAYNGGDQVVSFRGASSALDFSNGGVDFYRHPSALIINLDNL